MATTMLLTADDLLRLPDDGAPHELVDGELRLMTPAGGRHGAINMILGGLLFEHVRAHRLGLLFSEATGFRIRRDPDTVRCPDVAFLSRARIPAGGIGPGLVEGPPDLAVEVLSPGDTVLEVEQKVEDYLTVGVRAVWVVNPDLQRVTVHRADAAPHIFRAEETLEGGEALPGFTCPVRELFTWPE